MVRFLRVPLVLLILCAWPAAAAAQSAGRTVAGVVIRSDTRAPLAGATITAVGTSTAATTTDDTGRFALTVPAGRVRLIASADGYLPLETSLDLTSSDMTSVELSLSPNPAFAAAVNVVGTSPSISPTSTTVAPGEVLRTAGALDNVFRTLQTLPGVAAAEEFGSRLTVRGGAPDQNLTVMDGLEVHDPYRLFGLTSAFNPEIIRRFELATGGFSARYGDRLSSLLVIENRDGNSARRVAGTASASITDANLVLEGKWPGRARGSWLVTGRRTYYDLVAARVTDQEFPGFADVQTKAVWEWGTASRLTFFGLRSRQSAALTIDEDEANGAFNNDTRNDLASVRFDTRVGSRGRAMFIGGDSRTVSALGVDARFENTSRRSNGPTTRAFGFANVVFSQELQVRDRSLRHEFVWNTRAHVIEAGGEWHHLTTSLQYLINGDRNPNAANGSSVQGGAGLPDQLDSQRASNRGGGWLIDTFRIGSRATVELGVRVDHADINRETTVSPRLAVTMALTPRTTARASIGTYMQSPGYEKSAQSDYVLDLTAVERTSLKSERARLAAVSLERVLGRGVVARSEAFYKRLDQMLIGRLETESERLARTAPYDFPASLVSNIPTDPIITTVPGNGGRGRAYGFDVLVSRPLAPVDARVRGWISYTWGKAEREAYGRTFAFEYDRRHAVSAVASLRLSPNWELAATSRWATGFPRTAPVGIRVAGEKVIATTGGTTRTTIVPARDSDGLLMYEIDLGGVANLNQARLPDFARTDVRLGWKPRGSNGRWELYAEVLNVLNRKNAGVVSPELRYNPGSDRPRIVEQPDQSIPRLPTIGLRWRF